mgnify:CR=1 FL=1
MAELTYRDAVIRGIAQEMERDPDVVFLGEDVAKAGGVFKATVGLYEQFGPLRVRDTPISEQAIMGAAMGAAMTGLKPIAEIMFSDFFAVCFDYIANEFPKSRYMSNGQLKCPLVVRTGNGGGARFGAQHSQSVENWCMMIPGLKVVAPSSPVDVIGLLAAAVRDPDKGRDIVSLGMVSGVVVRDGLFNVVLGETTPFGPSVFADAPRFIGIQVGTDPEMVPRQRLRQARDGAVGVLGRAEHLRDHGRQSGEIPHATRDLLSRHLRRDSEEFVELLTRKRWARPLFPRDGQLSALRHQSCNFKK